MMMTKPRSSFFGSHVAIFDLTSGVLNDEGLQEPNHKQLRHNDVARPLDERQDHPQACLAGVVKMRSCVYDLAWQSLIQLIVVLVTPSCTGAGRKIISRNWDERGFEIRHAC
jgi:hypothetical protein